MYATGFVLTFITALVFTVLSITLIIDQVRDKMTLKSTIIVLESGVLALVFWIAVLEYEACFTMGMK